MSKIVSDEEYDREKLIDPCYIETNKDYIINV